MGQVQVLPQADLFLKHFIIQQFLLQQFRKLHQL